MIGMSNRGMKKIINCSISILLVFIFYACGESPTGRKQVERDASCAYL
jgi:hypothetical protein